MNRTVREILKNFGVETARIRKPSDAKLAEVYFVEDRYVLRSRPLESDTSVRFATECSLCEKVMTLTGFRFPQYKRSSSGSRFVISGRNFWTLHKRIPGYPLGRWFELHRADASVTRQVLKSLHDLHEMTTGRFDDNMFDRTRLFELIAPALAQAPEFLSMKAVKQVRLALNRAVRFCESYPSREGGFVHGDYHHGNILARGNRIIGFIDLDWCRVGSPYEDLAFTLMMLMRDYESWSHSFRWSMYHDMLDCYGFDGDANLLFDYLILYALFDCNIFKSARFDNSVAFFEYQKQFLETMCLSFKADKHG